MKVLFLGSGAADFKPSLYAELAHQFDKDARRSSAVLIDGQLLIDCGIWILNELEIAGVDVSGIRQVLVSHSHGDHFRADHLCAIAEKAGHPIDVYANTDILYLLKKEGSKLPGYELLVPHALYALPEPTPVEFDGYRVRPLRSNHQTEFEGEQTMFFLIEKDGKKLVYGTDGAWMPTASGKYLYGQKIDCYLFDATCGDYEYEYRIFEHNTLPMTRIMLQVLRHKEAFAEDAKLVLTHIAPSLHRPHAELVEQAAADGLLVAYDGMELEV